MESKQPNICRCGCLRPCGSEEFSSRHDRWNTTRQNPVDYAIEDRGFTTPCWIWKLRTGNPGYGKLKDHGRDVPAHRYYYEQYKGKIPEGMVPDHLCRVRCCVNPDHLEAVEPAINIRRGDSAKLTDSQIPEIFTMYKSGKSMEAVASAFGVSVGHISVILRGQKRKGVCDPIEVRERFKRKLSDDDIRDIRRRFASGEFRQVLADEYNVHIDHISSVIRGRRWGKVA